MHAASSTSSESKGVERLRHSEKLIVVQTIDKLISSRLHEIGIVHGQVKRGIECLSNYCSIIADKDSCRPQHRNVTTK